MSSKKNHAKRSMRSSHTGIPVYMFYRNAQKVAEARSYREMMKMQNLPSTENTATEE